MQNKSSWKRLKILGAGHAQGATTDFGKMACQKPQRNGQKTSECKNADIYPLHVSFPNLLGVKILFPCDKMQAKVFHLLRYHNWYNDND